MRFLSFFSEKDRCFNSVIDNKSFLNNRLTFEKEYGIILVNKDKHDIFMISHMIYRAVNNMREKV